MRHSKEARDVRRKMAERVLLARDEERYHDIPLHLMGPVWATLEATRFLSEYLTRWQNARRAAGGDGSAHPGDDDPMRATEATR